MTKKEKEARFIEIGRAGANHSLAHPLRKEWEALRKEIFG